MSRVFSLIALLAWTAIAQDVFVPPVLKGVQGEGQGRRSDRPISFPDPKENWILARSKHFVFVSSAGERRTRDIAAGLETLASALTQMSPRFLRLKRGQAKNDVSLRLQFRVF